MIEIFGVDVITLSLRMLHGVMAAAWLLFDFIVYWLHFGVKDESRPLSDRLERARIMHRIDQTVGIVFLLMLPTGIALCYLTDTPLFSAGWLNWKHVLYAVTIIDALYLIPISGKVLGALKKLEQGATNVDELNQTIRRGMNVAMPAVFLIWALVAGISLLTILNLKAPEDQEYIFRKSDAAITQPADPRP